MLIIGAQLDAKTQLSALKAWMIVVSMLQKYSNGTLQLVVNEVHDQTRFYHMICGVQVHTPHETGFD